jgi:hypothetical protein
MTFNFIENLNSWFSSKTTGGAGLLLLKFLDLENPVILVFEFAVKH